VSDDLERAGDDVAIADRQRRYLNRRTFLAALAAAPAAAGAASAFGAPAAAVAAPATRSAAPTAPPARTFRVPAGVASAARQAVTDPTEYTVAGAALALAAGRISAVELVDAHLDRIAAYESTYLAYNTVLPEQARAAARRADANRHSNPYAGIPLTVKDNYFTRGVRTTANSTIFADFVPTYDATAVARLVAAGAVVIGKGQMGPLATTRATLPNGTVTTVNAWTPTDPTVEPGGSSSGPATSVAGRLATTSIGTQTGGSITAPANAQNLTGLKPTMGRTSIHGVIPLSFTRDHSGPLARDVLDAAIVTDALVGPDPDDPRTLGLPPLPDLVRAASPVRSGGRVRLRRATRIGVPPDYLARAAPAVLAARRALLTTLGRIPGARLVDVSYPEDWALLTGTFNAVRLSERTEPFRPYLRQDLGLFGVSLLSWLQGAMLSGDEWVTGQRAKTHLLLEVLTLLDRGCDVLLQTSPVPLDILGLPEVGFPIGFGVVQPGDGTVPPGPTVPIGTILGGNPYEEDRLLEVVAAYQAVTDWQTRRPVDPPSAAAARARGQARSGSAALLAGRPRLDAATAAATSA